MWTPPLPSDQSQYQGISDGQTGCRPWSSEIFITFKSTGTVISIVTLVFWSENHQVQFVVVKSSAHEGSFLCSAWPLTWFAGIYLFYQVKRLLLLHSTVLYFSSSSTWDLESNDSCSPSSLSPKFSELSSRVRCSGSLCHSASCSWWLQPWCLSGSSQMIRFLRLRWRNKMTSFHFYNFHLKCINSRASN